MQPDGCGGPHNSLWTAYLVFATYSGPTSLRLKDHAHRGLEMHQPTLRLVLVVLIAACVARARADDGWKMPSLNPFARKAGSPTSARVSDSSGGWKLPSLFPAKKPMPAARKPAQPSAWQRMTSSTRKFWSTTADTLNPFNDADDKPKQPISATGANSVFTQAANRKTPKSKSKSFLPSWGSSEDEQPQREKSGGVNDFLALPRPGF